MTAALSPGDVLLAHATSDIARLINRVSRAPVHHAALVLDDGTIAEATTDLLEPRQLGPISPPKSLPAWQARAIEHQVDLVHVLRHRALRAGRDAAPVVARGRALAGQGHPYGADRLLLVALRCLTSSVSRVDLRDSDNWFRRALQALDDDDAAGRTSSLICSELVARAFLEADTVCGYAIDLAHTGSPRPQQPHRPGVTGESRDIPTPPAGLSALLAQAEPDSLLVVLTGSGATDDGPGAQPGIDITHGPGSLLGHQVAHLPGVPPAATAFFHAYLDRAGLRAPSALELMATVRLLPPVVCGLVPAFLTPGDLFTSPSFEHVAQLPPEALTC